MGTALRGKLRHAVLIGRAADEIEQALKGVCTVERCATLEEAVRAAPGRTAWGRSAVVAGVRQFGHVQRLCGARRRLRAGRAGSSPHERHHRGANFARSSAHSGAVRIDPIMVALALGIVLLGLVMVTSASISIASQATGEPFLYLERQLILTLLGAAAAALVFCVRFGAARARIRCRFSYRSRAPRARTRARPRPRRQRQPPLAQGGRCELPGI